MKQIFLYLLLILLVIGLIFSINKDNKKNGFEAKSNRSGHSGGEYVDPYITRKGKFVKGHVRKSVSTNPNAIRNQAKSRYYYETHKHIIKSNRKNKRKDGD
jgi:hypothetical protein